MLVSDTLVSKKKGLSHLNVLNGSGDSIVNPTQKLAQSGAPRPRAQGAISGTAIMTSARIVNVTIALVTTAIIARLLDTKDFGVVTMAAAATGFFQIFSDFGLSLVTVQRAEITEKQLTALFWINCGIGLLLALGTLAV